MTGVQTCALPIWRIRRYPSAGLRGQRSPSPLQTQHRTHTSPPIDLTDLPSLPSSTETPSTTTEAPTTPPPILLKKTANQQVGSAKPARILQGGGGKKLAADEKSTKKEPWKSVKDLKVVEETTDSAVLLWAADGLPSDTPLTVVYSADEVDRKSTRLNSSH